MNIFLLGPQGSGKGTQARMLVEEFKFFYLESGSFLRKVSETNEVLAKMLAEGKLVPDEEMCSYITAYLDEQRAYDNILFDGFPRTLDQYKFLRSWLSDKSVKIDLVFVLEIDEEETVKRLSARRMDPVSGKIYNLITDPPPSGIDRKSLVQRKDDTTEAIKKRLSWYKEEVLPLVSFLKNETRVIEVNGDRPIDEIFKELVSIIKQL